MPDILLTTLNARYAHCAFGLRYLRANMGSLADRTEIAEFNISDQAVDVLDAVLARNPRIVGVGVYIWNVEQATKLVANLKRVRPDVYVIIGGPEVSFEVDEQEIVRLADYVITGEADIAFAATCQAILDDTPPLEKVIAADVPVLDSLLLPYDQYTDEDIARRVIYVEASRGCPFTCEFCLSALEIPVRQFALEKFLAAMQSLLDRGARQFKFVDRTFNLNLKTSRAILEFFLRRFRPGMFLHFEMIPDRLPESLKELIEQFPPGSLQFEVGIQTFTEEVAEHISRRQDNAKARENLRYLRERTGVHVHADLIVGLPGESLESFARGFDELVSLAPQEIQVGMLKRLRGTPIVRHDESFQMVYSPHVPYEILRNNRLDFATVGRLRRFARAWDLVANSGNFLETAPRIWGDGSPFFEFLRFSDDLFAREGRMHAIPLVVLAERVFEFLVAVRGVDELEAARLIWRDYQRGGRSDRPVFLRKYSLEAAAQRRQVVGKIPRRQERHARIDRSA